MRALGLAALGLAAMQLAACGSDKPKPAPLEAITPQIAGQQVWSARLDGGLPFVLMPSVTKAGEEAFVVAGGDGSVLALAAQNGRELWRGSAGAPLTAGVGSDGRFAAVVTRDNELIVLDRGQPKWRTRLGSLVSTAPLVAGERVFVMGVDRVVQAYDTFDGRYLWQLKRGGEPLTLSQPGALAAFKDTLLVGQAQRLTGVDPLKGSVRWEVALANVRGTNEVERVADLVGPLVRAGDVVCARSSRPPSVAPMRSAGSSCGPRAPAVARRPAATRSWWPVPTAAAASPLANAQRRPGLDRRAVCQPWLVGLAGDRQGRWSSATSRARSTSSIAPTARLSCGCPPMGRR